MEYPTDETRIFYSDDPDSGATAGNSGNTSVPEGLDVYFRSTTPDVTAEGMALAEYRRNQLFGVERTRDTSKYLPFSKLSDGDANIIKDAHVTFLGVTGGATPVVTNGERSLYIPPEGQVLNFLDYRINRDALPDRHSESVTENVTKVYEDYQINWDRTGVDHRVVTVNDRVVGQAAGRPGARAVPYSNAAGSGQTTLTIRATISVWVGYDVVRMRNGNVTDRTEREYRAARLQVRDSEQVHVTATQSIELRQRLVTVEGESADRLVVRVTGPQSLQDRRLWSTLRFDQPSTVVNNWGVYSVSQYRHGYIRSGNGEEEFAFPHVPRVRFTSSYNTPYISTNYSAGAVSASPELSMVSQTNLSGDLVPLAPRVNLTRQQPTFVQRLVIKDTPGELQQAAGLFGQELSIQSAPEVTIQQSVLRISGAGDGYARVRLTDADTGRGLAGRQLSLQGAARSVATTNSSGVVVVNRTDRMLRVSFRGDGWREKLRSGSLNPNERYYSGVEAERLVLEKGLLWFGLVDVVFGFLVASPFILGWVWIRSMDTV